MRFDVFIDFYYPDWIETMAWFVEQNASIIDLGYYKLGTCRPS